MMGILSWLFKARDQDKARVEVEKEPHVKQARKQLQRARVLIEIDKVEQIAKGRQH